MSGNTITFSGQNLPTNATIFGTYNGVTATSGTSDGTTAVLTFSKEIPISTAIIALTIYFKSSDNTLIFANPLSPITFTSPLIFGSSTAECNPADSTCVSSYLASAFLADLENCPALDPECIIKKAASVRRACLGSSACEEALAAVALKQEKIDLNLNKDVDSITNEAHALKMSDLNDQVNKEFQNTENFNPCECLMEVLVKNLTMFAESSFFRTMQVGDPPRAHMLTLNDTVNKQCGQYNWYRLCGSLTFTFFNSLTNEAIVQWPFRGLVWEEYLGRFTLNPTNDDLGDHSFMMAILLQYHPTLYRVVTIFFNITPPSTDQQNRRLPAVFPGQCTGPTTNYNLLNTGVQAIQSYGQSGSNTNANQGCDGVIQYYNPVIDWTKLVAVGAMPANVCYWVAQFANPVRIQSILYLQMYGAFNVQFRVGIDNTNNYFNNPVCTGGQLTAGGWLTCALTGTYLALTSTTSSFYFMEVMAFSQEYIQHKALSYTLSSTMSTSTYLCTGTNCQALSTINTLNNPISFKISSQTDPTLTVTMPVDLMIAFVLLTPSDLSGSSVTSWQTNVLIQIGDVAGTQQLCGTLADYNLYTEVPCNKVGNKIIVKKPGPNMTLAMAGLSILSDCDCTSTSFNPASFTTTPTTLFVSVTSITIRATDPVQTITINKQIPDTISSACGLADGTSKCGSRSVYFYDSSGIQFSTFPYKGFSWDDSTSVGTLNPAQVPASYVITAKLQLINYPTVILSQDITVTLQLTAPTAPLALANNAAVTASGIVSLTWSTVASNGGTPVIDYQISYKPFGGTYLVLATLITTTSYTAISLTADVVYTFKVTARNIIGLGDDSSELIVRAAAKPSVPAAPFTVNSNIISVTITWQAPYNGGSQITAYVVAIRQSNGITFSIESANCNVSTTTCTVPIQVLNQTPFLLAQGASIYATVYATNSVGSSTASTSGNGAIIPTYPDPPSLLANNAAVTASGIVGLTWSAAAFDGGSPVIDYQISYKPVGGTYSVLDSVTFPTTSYTASLLTADIVYSFRISAHNLVGLSADSSELSARAAAKPSVLAPPLTLMNSNISVKIVWNAPNNGGSAITAYLVAIRQNDGSTYTTVSENCNVSSISCTIPISVLQAAPFFFQWGTSIYATVLATNAVGSSAASPAGNGAKLTTNPDAPVKLIADASLMALSWESGIFDGGTSVIDYRVSWDQGVNNFIVLTEGITKLYFIAQVQTQPSTVYKFKVQSRNGFGFSSYSNQAQLLTQSKVTLRIQPMSLNATINEESVLQLSVLPEIKYAVASIQNFTASVEEFQLKVKSTNMLDLGSQILTMSAIVLNETVYFNVTVNFKEKPQSAFSVPKTSLSTLAIAENSKDSTDTTTVEETTIAAQQALIAQLNCRTDDRGLTLCQNFAGEYCSFDNAKRMVICSANKPILSQTKTAVVKERATYSISRVDSQARFFIRFSEAMNFESIIAAKSKDRGLKSKSSVSSKSSDSKISDKSIDSFNNSSEYLLTEKQLSITLIPGGGSKSSSPLKWKVLSVTDKNINIQILFEDPLKISSEVGHEDKLAIAFLPSSLIFLTAKFSGLQVNDPCKTQIKVLPTQMYVGVVTESVEKATKTMETTSQTTTISNVVMQLVLSQSLAQMWSMVNSLQIILSMQHLQVAMPGNVGLVMGNLATMASFDVIQSVTIIESSFSFSETESPGIGFESMGSSSKRLIPYLGMSYLILLFVWSQYLAFCIAYLLKDKSKYANKYYQYFRKSLIWTQALLYMLESCLDIFTGVMLSLEQSMFETPSDSCDFAFTTMFVPLGIAFPLFSFFFLSKNISKLQEKEFKDKYGCLYEAYSIDTPEQRQNAIKMGFWFIVRRLLTAVSIVPLRRETVWIQLVCSMYLTLTDVCFKIHLNPYRAKVVSIMERFNDTIVLTLTYFNFLLTDLTPKAEDKYFIGWFYVGLVSLLLVTNLSVMLHGGIPDIIEFFKQKLAQLKQWWVNRKKALKEPEPSVLVPIKEEIAVGFQYQNNLLEKGEQQKNKKILMMMIQREMNELSEIKEESSVQSLEESPRRGRTTRSKKKLNGKNSPPKKFDLRTLQQIKNDRNRLKKQTEEIDRANQHWMHIMELEEWKKSHAASQKIARDRLVSKGIKRKRPKTKSPQKQKSPLKTKFQGKTIQVKNRIGEQNFIALKSAVNKPAQDDELLPYMAERQARLLKVGTAEQRKKIMLRSSLGDLISPINQSIEIKFTEDQEFVDENKKDAAETSEKNSQQLPTLDERQAQLNEERRSNEKLKFRQDFNEIVSDDD